MSMAKRLLALLLCLIMLFSVVACSSSDANGESDLGTAKVTEPTQAPDNYIVLAEYEVANYRVVYEKDLVSAVTKKITQNLDTLKTKIGVTMESVSDEALPEPTDMPEILIGETNREESKLATAKLRSGEYTLL